MSAYSSFVDTLTEIIHQETANVFEKCKNVDIQNKVNSETSMLLSDAEAVLLEDLNKEIKAPSKTIQPGQPMSISRILEDFIDFCHNLVDTYSTANECHPEFPLRAPFAPDHSANLLFPRLSASLVDSISLELELLIMTSCRHWRRSKKDLQLWTSFVLRDLEQAVKVIHQTCTDQMEHQICSTRLRLGRIYAWAREPSNQTEEKDEAVQNLEQLKKRIRSKLSRLVLLCRVGKRNVRSHPILASMRHELVRIRSQLSGSCNSDRTAAMGTVPCGLLQLSDWEEDCDRALKRFIPSNLSPPFCQLIDQLTDILLELPAHVPGISVPSVKSHSKSEQRNNWRTMVAHTVTNFYNHQDTWASIDLQGDDGIEELQTSGMALNLLTDQSGISDSEEESDPSKRISHTEDHQLTLGINPALVQAVLDRFDHHNRGSRKRHFSGPDDNFDEESGSTPKRTRPVTDPVIPEGSVSNVVIPQNDEIELNRPNQSPIHAVSQNHVDSPDANGRSSSDSMNNSVEQNSPRPDTDTVPTDQSPSKGNPDSAEDGSRLRSTKPRRSNRSLRTRRSRTPSEASYSEGEVLSDSDEDRDGASSVGEANETVPELLGEKVNAEGPDEERAAEIIQLVHNQLRDATPVSDIDLTELEIMDEWATPAAVAAVTTAASTTASNEVDIQLIDDAMDDHPAEITETDDGRTVSRMEETNKNLSELVSSALTVCTQDMDQLILDASSSENQASNSMNQVNPVPTTQIQLSEETEASIERTASAFQEHVTSVLANLLHAVPVTTEPNTPTGFKRLSTLPVVCGRRGARLLGMLKAYHRDAAKRMSSSNAV